MASTEEGTLTLPDGTKLYTKTWKPIQQPPRAILAFVHGFSDHCNAYYELFPTLASHGIEVRSFDQRGWGRSVTQPKDRGRTGPTSTVLSDMHSFFRSVNARAAEDSIPLFLMGHSMGGAQVLYYVLHPESPFNTQQDSSGAPKFEGVIAYSPLVALHPSSRPSMFTVKAGRLAGMLMPNHQRYSPLDPNTMSRDEKICADWAADELCHDTGTLEGLAGMLDRGIWLEELFRQDPKPLQGVRFGKLLPMWFGHGSGDLVTDYHATKRLAAALGTGAENVTFRTYDGAYHKLHADLPEVKTLFAADVVEWILARCQSNETLDQTQPSSSVPNAEDPESHPVLDKATEAGEEEGKSKL